MADNITLNAGSGGSILAADDIASVFYQRVKLVDGTADSTTVIAAGGGVEANALRVTIASDSTGVVSIDDNAGSLTVDNGGTFVVQVDGAALTALQLIDNTVYVDDADWTALTSSHNLIGGVYQSTPGTITDGDTGPIRLDANGAIHINDGGNSITVDGTVTANPASGTIDTVTTVTAVTDITNTIDSTISGAALTALQLIDNPVFADDAAFTLASSSVMMSGAIRDDSLSTLTAIEGDAVPLRVSSTGALHVTGGGGGTEYTEDVATANPIVGTATLMERDDALTTVTPIEGDWIGLRGSAEGALWTQDFNSDSILADTNTLVTNTTNLNNCIVQDDAPFTPATGYLMMVGGEFDDAAPDSVDEGDAGNFRISGNRNLYVQLRDAAGNERGLNVDASGQIAVTNGGTFATQATLQANSGVDIGDVDVISVIPGTAATNLGKAVDTAGGSTDTGVAMLAIRDDEQAAATPIDGDYVNLTTDKFRKLKVTLQPDATSVTKYAVINVASSGDNTIVAAAGAGIKIRVLAVVFTCGGTVNTRFESGAGGTALTGIQEWTAQTGMVLPYNPEGWFETGDNALLNLELSGAVNVDGCLTYVEV